jgi:hypothetical protein
VEKGSFDSYVQKDNANYQATTIYRPISLTSHVCKILESVVRDAILEHVNKYNLIKDSQHGFVGRSGQID